MIHGTKINTFLWVLDKLQLQVAGEFIFKKNKYAGRTEYFSLPLIGMQELFYSGNPFYQLPVSFNKAVLKRKYHYLSYSNQGLKNLLAGCRENSRQHEKQFFDWLKEFAANICYRYASSKIEVQDLVCDGFVRVFQNLHLYNEDIYGYSEAAFKGWFKKVLINNCINYCNKFYPKVSYSDESIMLFSEMEDESESVIDSMSYNEILGIVMQLPPGYKMVFNLFAIDGYSHEEIAGG